MANVLCQIQGEKRILLFPPTDVTKFDFEPGASSSSYNVFEALENNNLISCQPYETILKNGEVLFIPSLWLHTASPVSGVSVAVNVFFRDLKAGYAAGRDVYGNRDLQAYEKGRQDITRILKSFDGLPGNTRSFYLQRLVAEFQERVHG
jgi:tRNA wybutosine-synthesizing protein 4